MARIDHLAVHLLLLLAERLLADYIKTIYDLQVRNIFVSHNSSDVRWKIIAMRRVERSRNSRFRSNECVPSQIARGVSFLICRAQVRLQRETNKSYTSYELIFMYVLRLASIFYDRQQLHIKCSMFINISFLCRF